MTQDPEPEGYNDQAVKAFEDQLAIRLAGMLGRLDALEAIGMGDMADRLRGDVRELIQYPWPHRCDDRCYLCTVQAFVLGIVNMPAPEPVRERINSEREGREHGTAGEE